MSDDNNFINILIAEDNNVSREMMAAVLRTKGYRTYGAIDGESAIKVVEDREIDLAFVDINMAPLGGFEFIRYLVVRNINIPVVLVTASDASDLLVEATNLGVKRILQKPVEPELLVQVADRLLRKKGMGRKALATTSLDTIFTPTQLMQRAIELADKNAKSRRGGPYGAVISDKSGKILGEGVNGVTSRADPTAHAEVMAIRQAAEKLGRTDLSDCILYCSSQPTMMGQALVNSVGIKKVYYGLNHVEIASVRDQKFTGSKPAEYIALCHEEALAMFKSWESQGEKIPD